MIQFWKSVAIAGTCLLGTALPVMAQRGVPSAYGASGDLPSRLYDYCDTYLMNVSHRNSLGVFRDSQDDPNSVFVDASGKPRTPVSNGHQSMRPTARIRLWQCTTGKTGVYRVYVD